MSGQRSLGIIHRELELLVRALQGVEQLASSSDGNAGDVSCAMVPLLIQLEGKVAEVGEFSRHGPLSRDYPAGDLILIKGGVAPPETDT